MEVTIYPRVTGSSDIQLNDIFLSQVNMLTWSHMRPTKYLICICISRNHESKFVSEHTGHAVCQCA